METPLKILVSGDVCGKFDSLFSRINAVQKKAGKFDMLFCVGNFFADENPQWEKFANGSMPVPIPTFILGPNQTEHMKHYPDEDGCELCENVTFLGKKGIYTGASGLTVAYLSGREGFPAPGLEKTFHFDSDMALTLKEPLTSSSEFKGVDILLTSQWPKGVEKYASSPEGVKSSECGSALISQIAIALKPRYHFCAHEGTYYERQPYRNHKVLQEPAKHVTRFISLAKVKNPQKAKFLYAFSITPLPHVAESELTKQPEDATECPYALNSSLFRAKQQGEKAAQFFYDQDAIEKGGMRHGKRPADGQGNGPQAKKQPPKPKGPCWFCLGSPEVEKHLVVSVGDQTYLALAKGGLTPDHLLILPIGHHQSTVDLSDDILDEIEKYKKCLKKCFKAMNKDVVFFERNYKTPHLQIQAVPLPKHLCNDVKETFMSYALEHKCELFEIPGPSDLRQIVPAGAPFFHAELPNGERLLHRMKKISIFPIQFGREAMAHEDLLNMPERADWRQCKNTPEEEVQMRDAFREKFHQYDFNNQ